MKEIKVNDKITLKDAIALHRKEAIKIGGAILEDKNLTLVGISFIFCSGEGGPIAKVGLYSNDLEDEDK